MLIGVIADDFTGASDIAVTLASGLPGEGGLHTVQYPGVPDSAAERHVEAGVIALKSRSLPADEAVTQSLAACEWLLAQGCQQIVFKYCSTFDSTDKGNIGPVLDALRQRLAAKRVVVCPAFPAMGRTVYQGHLFVWDKLLNQSGMEHHPVTPMKDADIRRVLQRQSTTPVAHLPWKLVNKGSAVINDQLTQLTETGPQLVVVDALHDEDLIQLGIAVADDRLISGGSAIALALAHNQIRAGRAAGNPQKLAPVAGPAAILVGSCSGATRGQIAEHQKRWAVKAVDIDAVMEDKITPQQLAEFVFAHQENLPLVYSSGTPDVVAEIQQRYGQQRVSAKLDRLFGDTAQLLVQQGVRRLVVGGGETSGAVVSALQPTSLQVGQEIDPGVPALLAGGEAPVALALKSGNFGRQDFFAHALAVLAGESAADVGR